MNDYKYYSQFNWLIGADILNKKQSRQYYVDYMLNRTQSMFHYDGLPDSIPQRMLELYLQCNGNTIIAKADDGNLYAFIGGLGGEPDAYYRPTIATIANPFLKFNKNLKIDEECVVILNDSCLNGLLPMFNRYASMLLENDITLRTVDINLRIIALLTATDDKTKKAGEAYLKQIEEGRLGIIGQNAFLEGIKAQPLTNSGSNYLTQLTEYQQYLKASLFMDIGLEANYNMKRENLNEAETKMNNQTLIPLIDDMLNQRQIGIDKVNKMFGTNIRVSLDSAWELEHTIEDDSKDVQDTIAKSDDIDESVVDNNENKDAE